MQAALFRCDTEGDVERDRVVVTLNLHWTSGATVLGPCFLLLLLLFFVPVVVGESYRSVNLTGKTGIMAGVMLWLQWVL